MLRLHFNSLIELFKIFLNRVEWKHQNIYLLHACMFQCRYRAGCDQCEVVGFSILIPHDMAKNDHGLFLFLNSTTLKV